MPKGKKPLILSIDDMNYYEYMRGNGYADRLVLDKYNHVVSETKDKDGKVTQSESNDIVPILNQFVKTSRFFIEWTKRCSWFNWIQWGTRISHE